MLFVRQQERNDRGIHSRLICAEVHLLHIRKHVQVLTGTGEESVAEGEELPWSRFLFFPSLYCIPLSLNMFLSRFSIFTRRQIFELGMSPALISVFHCL